MSRGPQGCRAHPVRSEIHHAERRSGAARAAMVVGLWKSLNKSELVAAVLLIGLGVFVLTQAWDWPYLTADGPGPGFFPLWIGICIIVLATVLVALQVVHAIRQGAVEATNWKGVLRVLAGWAGLMVCIALLKPAGFVASFLLLVMILVTAVFRRTFFSALIVGVCASAGFWVLFVKLLQVQLPAGPWGF